MADLDVEKRWYITKLGFDELSVPEPSGTNGILRGVELQTPGYEIHLIQFPRKHGDTPKSPVLTQGWLHVAFSVPDILKAEAFLKASGVDVQEVRGQGSTVRVLVIHDPEGNQIELFPRSRPHTSRSKDVNSQRGLSLEVQP